MQSAAPHKGASDSQLAGHHLAPQRPARPWHDNETHTQTRNGQKTRAAAHTLAHTNTRTQRRLFSLQVEGEWESLQTLKTSFLLVRSSEEGEEEELKSQDPLFHLRMERERETHESNFNQVLRHLSVGKLFFFIPHSFSLCFSILYLLLERILSVKNQQVLLKVKLTTNNNSRASSLCSYFSYENTDCMCLDSSKLLRNVTIMGHYGLPQT